MDIEDAGIVVVELAKETVDKVNVTHVAAGAGGRVRGARVKNCGLVSAEGAGNLDLLVAEILLADALASKVVPARL